MYQGLLGNMHVVLGLTLERYFVIGNISSKELQGVISKIEGKTKREINSTIYSLEELKEKYKSKNNFITGVLKGPKIFLKGDENDLRKLVQSKQAH